MENLQDRIKLVQTLDELQKIRKSLQLQTSVGADTIALIPTMGNLHQGHMSLIKESIGKDSHIFISIFVNPKQFGPQEDFLDYPRTLQQDLELIRNAVESSSSQFLKSVIVFAPAQVEDVFPEGFSTSISVGEISRILCGRHRPGHFDGVTTVVYRLFSLIRPHHAYFGEKDYQQTIVIKRMVNDLDIPVKIHVLPTIRDKNGLALSSRNQYLKGEENQKALILVRTLTQLKALIGKGPWEPPLTQTVKEFIDQILQDPSWDYLEVRQAEDLAPPSTNSDKLILLGAMRVGKTRLIDNLETTLK